MSSVNFYEFSKFNGKGKKTYNYNYIIITKIVNCKNNYKHTIKLNPPTPGPNSHNYLYARLQIANNFFKDTVPLFALWSNINYYIEWQ